MAWVEYLILHSRRVAVRSGWGLFFGWVDSSAVSGVHLPDRPDTRDGVRAFGEAIVLIVWS